MKKLRFGKMKSWDQGLGVGTKGIKSMNPGLSDPKASDSRTPTPIRLCPTLTSYTWSYHGPGTFWGHSWKANIFNSITNQAVPRGAQPGFSCLKWLFCPDASCLHLAQFAEALGGDGEGPVSWQDVQRMRQLPSHSAGTLLESQASGEEASAH